MKQPIDFTRLENAVAAMCDGDCKRSSEGARTDAIELCAALADVMEQVAKLAPDKPGR